MIITGYGTFTLYEPSQNNAVALSLHVSTTASDFARTVYTGATRVTPRQGVTAARKSRMPMVEC